MGTRRVSLLLALSLLCACDNGEGGADAALPDGAAPDADTTLPCAMGSLPPLRATSITSEPLVEPVYVTQAPGRPDALWVLEKRGRIQLVKDGAVTTFLDLRSRVAFDGERGLLGLAFHPEYETNGRFFIFYTPSDRPQNVVAEYRRNEEDPDVADDDELVRLVELHDPESNHNGGMIEFGPDGFLYVAIGDGGGGGDQHGTIGNGLDKNTLFGKLLRLDVDASDAEYAAAGNPFSGVEGLPQIWAYGLRNPWRFSFDRQTGDLWIPDVGQARYEEINVLPRAAPGGANFGWRAYEGFEVFDSDTVHLVPEHTEPIFVIEHEAPFLSSACAITGGYVYRGGAIPALRGTYLFGDYCSPEVGALRYCEGEVRDEQKVPALRNLAPGLVSFGEDLAGELYLVYAAGNAVYRIEPG